MANYRFDGRHLKERGRKVGELRGDVIYDRRNRRLGRIDGDIIRDARNTRVARFDGRIIRDSGNRRIAGLNDVTGAIDGIGGVSLVAMWFFFVR